MRRSQGPGEMGFLGEAEQQTSEQFIYNRNEKKGPKCLDLQQPLVLCTKTLWRECNEKKAKQPKCPEYILASVAEKWPGPLVCWQRQGGRAALRASAGKETPPSSLLQAAGFV